jgi:hypothetical protein
VNCDLADDAATPAHAIGASLIRVTAVNDVPTWGVALPLVVDQGKSIAVTSGSSTLVDVEDGAAALTYRLTTLPLHGQLLLNGVVLGSNATFTQADIDTGALLYNHNDDPMSSDQFSVVGSDSNNATTAQRTIAIEVRLKAVVFIVPPIASTGGSTASTGSGGASTAGSSTIQTSAGSATVDSKSIDAGTGSPVVVAPPVASPAAANRGSTKAVTSSASDSGGSSTSATTDTARNEGAGRALTLAEGVSGVDKFSNGLVASREKALRSEADRTFGTLDFTKIRSAEENTQYANLIRKVVGDAGFINDVQKTRNDINQKIKFDGNVVASSTAVSAGLSIGYVIWLVRGGALISSLLASIPAWQLVDPLPVLGSMGGGASDDDDESLDEMIKKSRAQKNQKAQAAKAETNLADASASFSSASISTA